MLESASITVVRINIPSAVNINFVLLEYDDIYFGGFLGTLRRM